MVKCVSGEFVFLLWSFVVPFVGHGIEGDAGGKGLIRVRNLPRIV